ncbi:extracellular solute-binding protein, family 7 [Antarctobacter heliothermus]|uniref:Extracellular solute-binding protein, family 7 n=1 Tax=Antarctobacter heliothermus TaxID=74033 RepID=A0A239BLH9_9RHOB|nr:extracellular solute-binding protein, family 7 [Antarctobacter heliothermus]
MLEADLGAVNTKTVTANADFWGGLPDEVKGAIEEVAVAYRDHLAELAMERASEAREAYVAGGGTIVKMTEDQRAAWAASLPDIASEWAAGLDEDGKPGSDMLRAYLDKLGAGEGNALRDWTAGLSK